jgi:hypothetical protein
MAKDAFDFNANKPPNLLAPNVATSRFKQRIYRTSLHQRAIQNRENRHIASKPKSSKTSVSHLNKLKSRMRGTQIGSALKC